MDNASVGCVLPDRISGQWLVLLTVVGGVLGFVCVVGNFLIILAYNLTPNLQKPCTLLLTNLAFSDLLYGLLAFPLYVTTDFVSSLFCNRAFYAVRMFTINLMFNMQLNNITLIALERILGIDWPFFYQAHVTTAKTTMAAIVTWLFGIARAMFVAVTYKKNFRLVVLVEVPLLALLVLVSFFIYCRVYIVSRRHIKRDQLFGIRHQESKSQVAVLVAFINATAWLPVVFVNALSALTDISYWKQATVMFPFVCTCLNLAIYTYRMREFRDAINRLLNRHSSVMPAETKTKPFSITSQDQ